VSPGDRGRSAWWQALWPGIAALVAVMGIGRFVYTPILPEMMASGALTLREAGWLASANFLGYLVGAMAASSIHGRAAQAWLARAGLVLTVAMLAAMAVADSPPAWMALRFAAGVASAFALVFVSTQVLGRLTALGEGDRLIWLYSGVGIGIAGSSLLTIAGTEAGLGWRASWAIAAALAAVFSVLAWRGAGTGNTSVRGAPGASSGASVASGATGVSGVSGSDGADGAGRASGGTGDTGARDRAGHDEPPTAAPRAFRMTVFAYGLFGFAYVIHATYLPAMVRGAGYSANAASWVWVVVGLVALPTTWVWREVAKRHGARGALVGCYVLQGLTALAPLLGDSIVGAGIAAVGLGATFIPLTGLALPFARALDPVHSARAIGLMTAAFGAGQIVGPVAAAYLAEGSGGFGGPSVLACSVLLIAAGMMLPRLDAPPSVR
jgi:predicted MFS family arabinose efflux permease